MRPGVCVAVIAIAVAASACGGGGDDSDNRQDPAAAATAICRAIDSDSVPGESLADIEEAVDRYAAEGIAPSQLWHELDVTCGDEVDALFAAGEPQPDPEPVPPSELEPDVAEDEPDSEDVDEPDSEDVDEPDSEDVDEPDSEDVDEPDSDARTIDIGEATTCTMPWAEWSCTLQEVRVASAEDLNRHLTEDRHADVILQMRFDGTLIWLKDDFTSSLSEVLSVEFHGGDGLTYGGWLSGTCALYADVCLPGEGVPIQEAHRTGVSQSGWHGLPIPREALEGGRIEVKGVTYRWSG